MNLVRKVSAVAVAAILSACSSTPVDNSPKNLTTVVTAKTTLNGLYMPDNKGTQTVYTRENMRAIDQTAEFDSFYMRWANFDYTTVFRIEDNLLWQIDNDKEKYRECPLSGCTTGFDEFMAKAQESSDDEEEYETYADKSCNVELVKNDFTIAATNQQRRISGLLSEEFKATWTTEFKDENGKVDLNLIQFVFWTTTPNEEMTAAWKVHKKSTENYLSKVGDKNALVRLLGEDGFKAIQGFSGDVESSDSQQKNMISQKLSVIKGYPLSIKMEWFQKNEACPSAKKKRSDNNLDFSEGLGNAATSFFGNIIKDEADKAFDKVVAEWQKDARVRYLYEITSVSEELVHDSQFQIPHGFTIEDRQ